MRLSAGAKTKRHALFAELFKGEMSAIASIHKALDQADAKTMDNAVAQLSMDARSSEAGLNQQPTPSRRASSLAGVSALSVSQPGSTGTFQPLITDPHDYCQDVAPSEIEDDDEACTDEGGIYDLDNCTCNGDIGGGGGGGGGGPVADNTPIITGIDPSDWTAGSSQNVVFSGLYFGTNVPTLIFSPLSGIAYTVSSHSDSQIVALIKVAASTPNENVEVEVTSNGYGGSGFFGGSGGNSPTSSPVYAAVHAPMNSPEITVIAWINGQAPDIVATVQAGANQTLMGNLNDPSECALELAAWGILHQSKDLHTTADINYANAWLIQHSANSAPPSTIVPSGQQSAGNFRLFNDFGGGGGFYQVGNTPSPCGPVAPSWILNWVSTGQSNPDYNGYHGTSSSGKTYQIAEGRVGTMGQSVNQTINGKTTPWVWSVIEFDSVGNPTTSYHAMFPTYYVYVNGSLDLGLSSTQGALATFASMDDSYKLTLSNIP